jgi:hypothetical protein
MLLAIVLNDEAELTGQLQIVATGQSVPLVSRPVQVPARSVTEVELPVGDSTSHLGGRAALRLVVSGKTVASYAVALAE